MTLGVQSDCWSSNVVCCDVHLAFRGVEFEQHQGPKASATRSLCLRHSLLQNYLHVPQIEVENQHYGT